MRVVPVGAIGSEESRYEQKVTDHGEEFISVQFYNVPVEGYYLIDDERVHEQRAGGQCFQAAYAIRYAFLQFLRIVDAEVSCSKGVSNSQGC